MAGMFDDLIPAAGAAPPGVKDYRDARGVLHMMVGGGTFPAGTGSPVAPPAAATPGATSDAAQTAGVSPPGAPVAAPTAATPATAGMFDDLIPAKGPAEQISGGNALLRGITNPFGVSDEIGGAIQGGVDWAGLGPEGSQGTFSGGYDRFTKRARQLDEESADQHPLLHAGGQIVGGLVAMAPMAATTAGARMLGITGDTVLGRVGASVGSGAVIGGGSGYASGEGDNRLSSAASGGAMGAGLGLVAPAAGALLGKGVSAVDSSLQRLGVHPYEAAVKMLGRGSAEPVALSRSPHLAAVQNLAKGLTEDEVTPESLGRADPNAMFAELGGPAANLAHQAGYIAGKPGPGQQIIRQAIQDRAAGAPARVESLLGKTVGKEHDVFQLADALSESQRRMAAPAYATIRNMAAEDTPAMRAALAGPDGVAAIKDGARLASLFHESFDPQYPTIGSMDYVKRAFDDKISKAIGNDRTKALATGLQNRRDMLVQELDRQSRLDPNDPGSSAYARARNIWAGHAVVKDALEEGKTIFDKSLPPQILERQLRSMSESERQALVIGVRFDIAKIMGMARDEPGAAISIFKKGWNVDNLQQIVGKEQTDKLLEGLAHEKALKVFSGIAAGNSETFARLSAKEDIEQLSWLGKHLGMMRLAAIINGVRGLVGVTATHVLEGGVAAHDAAFSKAVAEIMARGHAMTGSGRDNLVKALLAGATRTAKIKAISAKANYGARAAVGLARFPAGTIATHAIVGDQGDGN